MSRIPPRMEQRAAIQAKVYHVLPVSTGGKVFSVESSLLENITGQIHEVVCTTEEGHEIWRTRIFEKQFEPMLETDVQEVFVVDLFLKKGNIGVTLEHRNPIFLNESTGQILSEK